MPQWAWKSMSFNLGIKPVPTLFLKWKGFLLIAKLSLVVSDAVIVL